MIDIFRRLSQQRLYWVLLALLGVFLEAAALYYQYVRGEWPCVLCIHVRIWVMAMIVVGIVGALYGGSPLVSRLCHLASVGVAIGFAERNYQVLAVERGWVFGDCSMELGMPWWFALDQWAPWIFEVQTSCGYTPYVLFDITMAETLVALSALLLLATIGLFAASWLDEPG